MLDPVEAPGWWGGGARSGGRYGAAGRPLRGRRRRNWPGTGSQREMNPFAQADLGALGVQELAQSGQASTPAWSRRCSRLTSRTTCSNGPDANWSNWLSRAMTESTSRDPARVRVHSAPGGQGQCQALPPVGHRDDVTGLYGGECHVPVLPPGRRPNRPPRPSPIDAQGSGYLQVAGLHGSPSQVTGGFRRTALWASHPTPHISGRPQRRPTAMATTKQKKGSTPEHQKGPEGPERSHSREEAGEGR